MKKYLGIVKIIMESFTGVNYKVVTKFSDDKSEIEKWIQVFPKNESIILENNKELESFFKDFEDYFVTTEEERKKAEELYARFMKES